MPYKERGFHGVLYYHFFIFAVFGIIRKVAGKLGDKKCDYELIIEHQLNVKATVE